MRTDLPIGAGFVVLAAALAAGPAAAHHSYAAFDRNTSVTIEGEVAAVEWTNPHVILMVKTADGREYRIEWWNTQRLERAGLAENPFAVGDAISLTGAAHRDPDTHVMTLLTEVSRPSDGWTWRRTWLRNGGVDLQTPGTR